VADDGTIGIWTATSFQVAGFDDGPGGIQVTAPIEIGSSFRLPDAAYFSTPIDLPVDVTLTP
jgi:hypothetical protein